MDMTPREGRMAIHIRRRDALLGLGGTIAAWPSASRGQQLTRMRRIGVLLAVGENDPEGTGWFSSFKKGLQELGWGDGSTVHVDVRWAAGNPERMRMFAQDLISQQSEVIVAHGTPVTRALQRATQTIPIVFVTVSDPVGEGYVASLSRPGGNLTGFLFAEAEMGGKWLELLKEI